MSRQFDCRNYASLTDLVLGHKRFLVENVIKPFVARISPLIDSVCEEVRALRATLLDRPPVETFEMPGQAQFYSESEKRDVGASLRRYAVGVQTRALHIRMREAWTKEEHLAHAMALEHPNSLAGKALEPDWQYVFAQLSEAFHTFGVPATIVRLNDYRYSVMKWIRRLAVSVTPLQEQLNAAMPEGISEKAGHIKTVLLFLLLTAVGYPNPDLAWRFFHGAPIVGEFHSAGLRPREKVQGTLSDDHIRQVARECEQQCGSVTRVLEPPSAKKAMEKQKQDFASGALKGPFKDKKSMIRAMEQYVRKHTGFKDFKIPPDLVIVSPQFTVSELHAYQEAVETSETEEELNYKVRNIFNAKKMNVLTASYSTYIPNTHGDVSVVILYYVTLLVQFCFPNYTILGWPADYKQAYRQMPIELLHCLFAATCYYDYDGEMDGHPPGKRWAFYTSLPFGSSLAPAGWGELLVALAFILARLLLIIVTHCVDDVANFEIEELITSAREAFLEINSLLGLVLDMDKTKAPMNEFIYLGLKLLLPSTVTRRELRLQVPEERRLKLIQQINKICESGELTSGLAASMRGRLYFYMAWYVACRGFLSYLACRQYSTEADVTLNDDLRKAFAYFSSLLHSSRFQEGIYPGRYFSGRTVAWLYTDGAREPGPYADSFYHHGIGGVIFPSHSEQPVWYGESLDPRLPGFAYIAAIEMYAILRALKLFAEQVRGKALFLFCDNSHAVGCLLRRGSSLKNSPKDVTFYGHPTPQQEFLCLSDDLRYTMNQVAQEIWKLFDELDVVVWIEYVWTEVNLADPPSRREAPPTPHHPDGGRRVGEDFDTWVAF